MKKINTILSFSILLGTLLSHPTIRTKVLQKYQQCKRNYMVYKLKRTFGINSQLSKTENAKKIIVQAISDLQKLVK